jgi:trehalose-phosphatase
VAGVTRDSAVWIEDKSLSLVIHTRLTAEPDRFLEKLRTPVAEATAAAGLEVRPGKEVLEICIPGYDKGAAIRKLIGDETAAVFYAGDDIGDVPALREVNAWSGRSGRPKLTVACVRSPHTSDGITRADACLAEADRAGYRPGTPGSAAALM